MTTIITKRGPQAGTKSRSGPLAIETVQRCWPTPTPDWVLQLAEACDRTSQNVVAKKLRVSASVISQVVNCKYLGSYEQVEKTARGVLLSETLDCPVLGELKKNFCNEHQKRALRVFPSSGARTALQRHCRGGCVHSRLNSSLAKQ